MTDEGNIAYTVVSQYHLNNLNQDGSVTPGWQVTVRDSMTGVTVPIFVPDDKYTAEGVQTLARHHLAITREVHSLTD